MSQQVVPLPETIVRDKLVVPFPRTNYLKNSFSYSDAALWNSLPCNFREAKRLKIKVLT